MPTRKEKADAMKAKIKEQRKKLSKITEIPTNEEIPKLKKRREELVKRKETLQKKTEEDVE